MIPYCAQSGRTHRCPHGEVGATRRKPRAGFTIIELMVVLVVLGILIGIVLLVGRGAGESARVRETEAVLQSLNNAISVFRDRQGVYPPWPDESDGVPEPWDSAGPYPEPVYYSSTAADDSAGDGSLFQVQIDSSTDPKAFVRSSEGLDYLLRTEPQSREILSKVPEEVFRAKVLDAGSQRLRRRGTAVILESRVMYDPWGNPLIYRIRRNTNNRLPFVSSAGPDGILDTADDIFSYKVGN